MPGGAGVLRIARGAGLSDAGRRIPEDRCVSATATLVVELVTEELPPKALKRLSGAFSTSLADHLRSRGFIANDNAVTCYATPRRLAVSIERVANDSKAPNSSPPQAVPSESGPL